LLLDTHAARWFLNSDDRLGENASRHLTDSNRPDQFSCSTPVCSHWQ
jgi:PIN domain nuclease of toxin-antitoxin system